MTAPTGVSPASRHLLVRAARGEPIERPPVWAMRQAGRAPDVTQKAQCRGLADSTPVTHWSQRLLLRYNIPHEKSRILRCRVRLDLPRVWDWGGSEARADGRRTDPASRQRRPRRA